VNHTAAFVGGKKSHIWADTVLSADRGWVADHDVSQFSTVRRAGVQAADGSSYIDIHC